MTDNYSADASNIRYAFVDGNRPRSEEDHVRLIGEFDRWLEEYTRQQREEAWDEGWIERSLVVDVPVWENPYRRTES